MIPEIMIVGSENPVQIGMVCSEKDYDVLIEFKKYFMNAMNAIAGKRVSVRDMLASDTVDERLLGALGCDVLLIILSIDLLADEYFIREETGLADMLISQMERNKESITGIYILARNVDIHHVPQPKSEKIMILPINQLPINSHENKDDAYITLCRHIALEIQRLRDKQQHLRDQQIIKELREQIKELKQK